MPRKARIVVEKVPCHVTQRGNNRQNIFFVADDYKAYLGQVVGQRQFYQQVGEISWPSFAPAACWPTEKTEEK